MDFKRAYAETVSYKEQMKNSGTEARFNKVYDSLVTEITCSETQWDCFLKLTQLKDVIRDEHSRVFSEGITDSTVTVTKTDFYKELPKVSLQLDSLETKLQQKPFNDIEGIYFAEGWKYGVYKDRESYKGVVLESKNEHWTPGMMAFDVKKAFGNKYRIAWIDRNFTKFRSLNAETIVGGRFLIYGITKDLQAPFYYKPKEPKPFFYEELSEDIGYMRVATFSWNNGNVAKANAFFDTTFPSLTVSHLILDVRNNGGGTDKIGKPLRKALKKYAKKNKVYILVNALSASNAEQTAWEIGKLKNVQLLGDQTAGVINYGLNYGEKITLPSGRFSFYLTDLTYRKFEAFESVGIPVDIPLHTQKDWVEQVLELIAQQK
ncbi:MAG: hypothetical protein CMC74_08310 [Flavobacteriaceae bacterium]|nr:hypothetical protein [Flavobacteriaceae bacterium]